MHELLVVLVAGAAAYQLPAVTPRAAVRLQQTAEEEADVVVIGSGELTLAAVCCIRARCIWRAVRLSGGAARRLGEH